MSLEITAGIVGFIVMLLLLIALIVIAGYLLHIGWNFAHGDTWLSEEKEQKPDLKCIRFSDGKLAVILIGGYAYGFLVDDGYVKECQGHIDTINWFISKGYVLNMSTGWEVYMTR